MRRFLITVLLALGAASLHAVDAARTNVAWWPELPPNIHALFVHALETLPETPSPAGATSRSDPFTARGVPGPTNRAELSARHRRTLESLRQIEWPVMTNLTRVRYRRTLASSNQTNLFETAWLIERKPEALLLLDDTFRVSRFSTNWFSDLQTLEFKDELDVLEKFLRATNNTAPAAWPYGNFRYFHSQPQQYIGLLFHAAYAAAALELTNEAIRLVHLALRSDRSGQFFEQVALNAAATAYDEAMALFDSPAARSEVLVAWERFARTFPQSPLTPQLSNYVVTLRQQVEDFPKVVATTVENPERLPIPDRAEYYLARFPDIPKTSNYEILRHGETHPGGRILELGYKAIPALIKHLGDRRLTRHTAPPHGRPRLVLRVQDLALTALEKITQVRFRPANRSTPFSEDSPEVRDKLVADVKGWWDEHAGKPPLEGQLAQLDNMPLNERLHVFRRLSQQNPGQIDALARLRKWATDTPEQTRWMLAGPMAEAGDTSLLPLLRQRLEQGMVDSDRILFRFGQAEDYAALRRAQWQMLARGKYLATPYSGLAPLSQAQFNPRQAATNWIAVPLVVDLLEARPLELRRESSRVRAYTSADAAMPYLADMTGFTANYSTNAPLEERMAAMDRWLKWWNDQGRDQFVAAHPEVAPVAAEERVIHWDQPGNERSANVFVRSAQRSAPVFYHVPAGQWQALLRSGDILGKRVGKHEAFWFESSQAEKNWFGDSARHALAGSAAEPGAPPAMHIAIVGRAAPDSLGRMWTCWSGGSPWPARYERQGWKSLSEDDLPITPRGFDGFPAAIAGAKGAMFFVDYESHVWLHDDTGWIRSEQRFGLATEQTIRVREALSFPGLPNASPEFELCPDERGNVWTSSPDKGVTVHSSQRSSSASWPPPSGRFRENRSVSVLIPLHKGGRVLAVTPSGFAAVFVLRDDRPVTLTELDLPIAPVPQARPLIDARSWVWLGDATNSIALDAEGRIVSQHPGLVVATVDRSVWFVERPFTRTSAVSVWTPDHPERRLGWPGLIPTAAVAPNETVWLLAQPRQLVRVGLKHTGMIKLEEWDVPVGLNDVLWCDKAGRVWRQDAGNSRHGELVCYPMRP